MLNSRATPDCLSLLSEFDISVPNDAALKSFFWLMSNEFSSIRAEKEERDVSGRRGIVYNDLVLKQSLTDLS